MLTVDDSITIDCPTCDASCNIEGPGRMYFDGEEEFGWPHGSIGHVSRITGAWCISHRYREPWWLRLARWVMR
jgi:hypothetical protein